MFDRKDLGQSRDWSLDASMPSREGEQGVAAKVMVILEKAKQDPKFARTELAKALKNVAAGEEALKRIAPEVEAKEQAVREAVKGYQVATQQSERHRAEAILKVKMQSLKAHEDRYQAQEKVVQVNRLLVEKIEEILLGGRGG